jgi:uncharacterized protein (DUF433 family)
MKFRGTVSATKNIMGGTPVFSGTRVPIQTLFDYLEAGDPIDVFLEDFPTVKRAQVLGLLSQIKKELFQGVA